MVNKSAVPLAIPQIEAANELHLRLEQWRITDTALQELHVRFPGFDIEATLLKVVAVNQLYGTNVYAVDRMAKHIVEVMHADMPSDNVKLVEKLAALPALPAKTQRNHISFASKLAHFFIDKERFPIFDSYAEDMVKFHLSGQEYVKNQKHPYPAFVQNLMLLRKHIQGSCSYEALDRYLWLSGLYRAYKTRATPKINREVEELFKSLSLEDAPTSLLQAMLPAEFAYLQRRKPRTSGSKKQ